MKTELTMETVVKDTIELSELNGEKTTLNLSYTVQELYHMYETLEELQKKFRTKKRIIKHGVSEYADEILKLLLGKEYNKLKTDYTLASKENLIKTIISSVLTPRLLSYNKKLAYKYAKAYKA